MKQLRYLKECELDFTTREKQPNGSYKEVFTEIETYKIQLQELNDQISASIYGANVNRMYRISSSYRALEDFLDTKMQHTTDNISKYTILIDEKRYKIITVRNHWIDIELI